MSKFIINSSMILMFLMSTSLALPTDNTQQKLNRVKRSFLSSYFWKSTEPSVPAVENIQSIENSQTIFAVPRSVNSNVPPSFVPVIPLQHFVSAAGQHFIAVKPVNVAGPNWILDNLVEQPKPHNPLKKPSKTPLDLTPSEVTELNQLARVIGVRDLNDLPPLEEVMTLLGTTSKSETIKAIRDYASTPGGLELIKEYVDSYQPVKRMDLLEKEISNNLVSNPRAFFSAPEVAPEWLQYRSICFERRCCERYHRAYSSLSGIRQNNHQHTVGCPGSGEKITSADVITSGAPASRATARTIEKVTVQDQKW
ncbi:uncharacterized protein LOC129725780 isoform X3 [Wyeomyia smithii]|uniref:uncharacterized protein LOC129725780 isoform X3 n=1 Tax=Wyeomyia smithii TaxID=174621 RepID=UPI00246800E4|nr:uncharacterized protein LOC129725780 isoform X3 [Wyeomyia smithii]